MYKLLNRHLPRMSRSARLLKSRRKLKRHPSKLLLLLQRNKYKK
jgi:hypothetical protein